MFTLLCFEQLEGDAVDTGGGLTLRFIL